MPKILVAEDEKFPSDLIAKVLTAHELTFVERGEDALKLLQQSPGSYDLVVTDWNMKAAAMEGPDLILAMRGDPKLTGIPAILHSSHAKPPKELAGVEFSYVEKDFDTKFAPLVEAVAKILQ